MVVRFCAVFSLWCKNAGAILHLHGARWHEPCIEQKITSLLSCAMPDCTAPRDLAAGHSAWQASLALQFSDDAGTTRLTGNAHYGPLRVQKSLHPEGAAVCHAIIVHPPGGVVGGDQLAIEATVGARAHALLTTPGAAKWYKANGKVLCRWPCTTWPRPASSAAHVRPRRRSPRWPAGRRRPR